MADLIQNLLLKSGVAFGNESEYPIMSNRYFAIFGKAVISFSKISGLTLLTNKNTAVNEGGRFEPYITTEPVTELSTMTLEKGFGTLDLLSIAQKSKTFILVIRGDDHSIKNIYYTDRMSIDKMSISELDAKSSMVLVQNVTVSYTYLRPMPELSTLLPSSVSDIMSTAGLDNATILNAFSTEGSFSELTSNALNTYTGTTETDETIDETTDEMTSEATYLGAKDGNNIANDTARIKAEKEAKQSQKLANQEMQNAVDTNTAVAQQVKELEEKTVKEEQVKSSFLEDLIQL